jgi:hypothetical protein
MESAFNNFEQKLKLDFTKKICECNKCRAKTSKNNPCTAKGTFDGFCGKHKNQSTNEKYFVRKLNKDIIYHLGHLPGEFLENCPRCKLLF